MSISPAQKNGPASAPTLPDRGSRNPSEGKALNMGVDSTTDTAPATTTANEASGKITLEISRERLASLSMLELLDLRQAIRTLGDVASGNLGRPCFWYDKEYNAAGAVIEEITELFGHIEQAVVDIARDAEAQTSTDAELRAWIMIRFEADCASSLDDVAFALGDGLREKQMAVRRERGSKMNGEAA